MSSLRHDLQPGVNEPVILMVSRTAVERDDLASVLGRLKLLSATREDAWLYRGQLSIVFEGYEDDPRELVDVPEVRRFVVRLNAAWPYWAFFMNQLDSTISLWLACLCGKTFPGSGQVELDIELLREMLRGGFDGMNTLFDRHGFSEDALRVQIEGLACLVGEMANTGG